MATIQTLPNEILLAIVATVTEVPDLAAVALTSRQLTLAANPALYAAAARDAKTATQALFFAAENGFFESARVLLHHGADPNAYYRSHLPRQRLHRLLAAQGRRPGRQLLVDRNLALDCIRSSAEKAKRDPTNPADADLSSLLPSLFGEANDVHEPGGSRQYETLQRRMQVLATQPPGAGPPNCWTALHVAADHGDSGLAKLLLEHGANINALAEGAHDPASAAMSRGSDLVFWRVPSRPRYTALYIAICNGHDLTTQLLLAHGASTTVSAHSVTALDTAACYGALQLCKFLIDERRVTVERRRFSGVRTPFHYAVASGHLRTVGRFLLQRGANIRAPFNVVVNQGSGTTLEYNAFTHALHTKRYSDAALLLEIDPNLAFPRGSEICPFEACLTAHDLSQSDEEEMLPVFQRLLPGSAQDTHASNTRVLSALALASKICLPRTLGLLMTTVQDHTVTAEALESWLSSAICHARSGAGLETVMVLLNYGSSLLGLPTPGINCAFTLDRQIPHNLYGHCPLTDSPQLRDPQVFAARLQIAKMLHQRHTASPHGVDGEDLRNALLGACQPGGRKACEWLSSVGALHYIRKDDFSIMLNRTALPTALGGQDPELADWVLVTAAVMGHRDWLLNQDNVRKFSLPFSDSLQVVKVIVDHGGPFIHPQDKQNALPVLFSCHTRQRILRHERQIYNSDHIMANICARPEEKVAVDLLAHIIHVAGEGASSLVNCSFELKNATIRRITTPASIVCNGHTCKFHKATPFCEPARLAMLKMLLDAGAEVHSLAQRNGGWGTQALVEADHEEPTEPLWCALALQDQDAIRKHQTIGWPRWEVYDWHENPVQRAITGRMPTLVRAMLEARPLPISNSPVALRYLQAACGGIGSHSPRRISPQVLEVVLNMANLDHADLPLTSDGETALMTLLWFYRTDKYDSYYDNIYVHPHQCKCEAELIEFEKYHLSECVCLLLERGAKWNTRCRATGRSALDELRDLLGRGMVHTSAYKYHNLAIFRKHVVLDINSAAADSSPNFNPFEMGKIKATRAQA